MEPNGKLLPIVIQVRCPGNLPPKTVLCSPQPLLRDKDHWLLSPSLTSFSETVLSPITPFFLAACSLLTWNRLFESHNGLYFQLQELQYHLLNNHLLAKVIAVATIISLTLSYIVPPLTLLILPSSPHLQFSHFASMCIFIYTGQCASANLGQVICNGGGVSLRTQNRRIECMCQQPGSLSGSPIAAGLSLLEPRYHAEATTHLQGYDKKGYCRLTALSPPGPYAQKG
ncbi:hypothetical protein HPG69_015768 [Diceros bicornis minor]|uniref:Uncharacterized protein n=1 Tax=Diceros bicornis minor TaxID=77932 RepID=A0A7J7E7K0_DICBM|nr:hypothetical protein HPG69_015768 [Diceros bicornis minor]